MPAAIIARIAPRIAAAYGGWGWRRGGCAAGRAVHAAFEPLAEQEAVGQGVAAQQQSLLLAHVGAAAERGRCAASSRWVCTCGGGKREDFDFSNPCTYPY